MQKCNVEPFEARRPVYFGYHIKVKQQNQSEKKQKKTSRSNITLVAACCCQLIVC